MRRNQLHGSVAADNDCALDLLRNNVLPIGLPRTDVRDIVSGALENPDQLSTVCFSAKCVRIMDKRNLHLVGSSTSLSESFCPCPWKSIPETKKYEKHRAGDCGAQRHIIQNQPSQEE